MWGIVQRALIVAALAATAGCGSRVLPSGAPQPLAASIPSPGETSVAAPPAVKAPAPLSASEQRFTVAELLGTQPASKDRPHHNNGMIRITLSTTCVRVGDVLVATLDTPPKAGLTMTTVYRDGNPHGAYNVGESDESGRFVWRLPITPDVPTGYARLFVMATGADWEGEGATAQTVFVVTGEGVACPDR